MAEAEVDRARRFVKLVLQYQGMNLEVQDGVCKLWLVDPELAEQQIGDLFDVLGECAKKFASEVKDAAMARRK